MNDIYNRDKIIRISINKIEKRGEIIFKKKTFWHKAHYEIYAPCVNILIMTGYFQQTILLIN